MLTCALHPSLKWQGPVKEESAVVGSAGVVLGKARPRPPIEPAAVHRFGFGVTDIDDMRVVPSAFSTRFGPLSRCAMWGPMSRYNLTYVLSHKDFCVLIDNGLTRASSRSDARARCLLTLRCSQPYFLG